MNSFYPTAMSLIAPLLFLQVGWLVRFYGILTILGYLTPNPFLCKLSVLFQTIQFSISIQFNCQKHFYFEQFVYSNSSNSANSVLNKHRFCLHTVKCQNSSMLNNSV